MRSGCCAVHTARAELSQLREAHTELISQLCSQPQLHHLLYIITLPHPSCPRSLCCRAEGRVGATSSSLSPSRAARGSAWRPPLLLLPFLLLLLPLAASRKTSWRASSPPTPTLRPPSSATRPKHAMRRKPRAATRPTTASGTRRTRRRRSRSAQNSAMRPHLVCLHMYPLSASIAFTCVVCIGGGRRGVGIGQSRGCRALHASVQLHHHQAHRALRQTAPVATAAAAAGRQRRPAAAAVVRPRAVRLLPLRLFRWWRWSHPPLPPSVPQRVSVRAGRGQSRGEAVEEAGRRRDRLVQLRL